MIWMYIIIGISGFLTYGFIMHSDMDDRFKRKVQTIAGLILIAAFLWFMRSEDDTVTAKDCYSEDRYVCLDE